MLIVDTYIKETLNKGIGLFSNQKILKGEKIWMHDNFLVKPFNKNDIPNNEYVKKFIEKYAWTNDNETYYLSLDNERFINHSSKNPNIEFDDECGHALVDINSDEELLCDYTKFDIDSIINLGFDENE